MAVEQIILDIRAQVENATKEIKQLKTQVSGVNKEVSKSEGLFKKAAGAMAALFSVALISRFVGKIIEVRAEFEKYNAVLKNTLGSAEKANIEFAKIQKFASETPFSVRELTNAFVKLVNQGFKPTTDQMKRLGDLAASTGKSFDQLTEAIIDATVGEFERLKEFGIRAQKSGDQVKFTFKEVETQVDFTAKSIREYILSLGDLQGVEGAMVEISKTLGGQISNLGDSWDSLLDTLGGRTSGVFSFVIRALNFFISAAENAAKSIEDIRSEVNLLNKDQQAAADIMEFQIFINRMHELGIAYESTTKAADAFLKNWQDDWDTLNEEQKEQREIFIANIYDWANEEDAIRSKLRLEQLQKEMKANEEWLKSYEKTFDEIIKESEKWVSDMIAGQEYLTDREIDQLDKLTEHHKRSLSKISSVEKMNTNLSMREFKKWVKVQEEDSEDLANYKIAIRRMARDVELNIALDLLGAMTNILDEESALYKAAVIGQATISAIQATINAYNSASAIPMVGWILGPIAATAAAIFGATAVAQIAGVSFEEGGFTGAAEHGFRDAKGKKVAGLVHENEFVFDEEKTRQLRPFFEDIHNDRISARELAELTRRGIIVPIINNDFNSEILEREVGKIYQKMHEKEPRRYTEITPDGLRKIIGNTTINISKN